MTAISGRAPQPCKNNPLITSEEEHLRLIAQEVSAKSLPIFNIAHLVAQYAHDKSLTNWHTALSRLNLLPEQIPPLHLTIDQIRDGICPIRGSFYLLPRGSLNQFKELVSGYGEKHLAEFGGENPLKFRYFWGWSRLDHDNTQFEKEGWRWMSDDILEGSRNRSYAEQDRMIKELGANFEIPSLRDAAECLFLHKIATGESILQQGNEQNGGLSTFTHVQETIQRSHLAIGGSDSSGVDVYYVNHHFGTVPPRYNCDNKHVGVVVLGKF